jgi:hypothetical protein
LRQGAAAETAGTEVGGALRVVVAGCVVLAARRDLHEVAGEAFSASSTLFSASAFGTEGKSAGVRDDGR